MTDPIEPAEPKGTKEANGAGPLLSQATHGNPEQALR
jgi:hypothetical protein